MASEYGWSRDDILNKVYPDDLIYLSRKIRVRRIDDYLMQGRLIANPYIEPSKAGEFMQDLVSTRDSLLDIEPADERLDRTTLARFKNVLRKESNLIKVK